MMTRLVAAILLTGLTMPLSAFGAEVLTLCADERNWYPFTYQEAKQAKGMHIDIVTKALESLRYEFTITPLPRKRCLINVQNGETDGMISVAYDPELAETLDYPADAATTQESQARMMQVDHVIVTARDDSYDFAGDLTTLPLPVRIPAGEVITERLRHAGLRVEEVKTDEQNFQKLLRDQQGVIITTSVIAETMNQRPEYAGKFTIHATPLISQSYHLVFSKKAPLSPEQKQAVWDAITTWREDYVFMLQVFAQY